MDSGDHHLIQCIRSEIEQRGPISFARFMQQALYHPEYGYYSSGRCVIGREGDYFTNVSVGPLFGQLLATQFVEVWERLGKTDRFVIIEQGAHDGQFARDVLEAAQRRAAKFFEALHYRIIEPFRVLQESQSRTLQAFGDKVEWHESLAPFEGVHFSNELLDAIPVRVISGDMEKLVHVEGGRFVFVERAVSATASAPQTLAQQNAFNQLTLEWGVFPATMETATSVDEMIDLALARARDVGGLATGARVVLTAGRRTGTPGATNLVMVREIP